MALNVNCKITFGTGLTDYKQVNQNYFVDNDLNLYNENKELLGEIQTIKSDSEDNIHSIMYQSNNIEVYLAIGKNNLHNLK